MKNLVFGQPILERIEGYKSASLRENPEGRGSTNLRGELK